MRKEGGLFLALLFCLCLLLSFPVLADQERAQVGDVLSLGTYPQGSGGEREPIEWLVLSLEGDRVLLLSRYGLDVQPYHISQEEVTWEGSTLRGWLNGSFLNDAFTQEERGRIVSVQTDNSAGQGFPFSALEEQTPVEENFTQDQVFLLSFLECSELFDALIAQSSGLYELQAIPTPYALKRGALVSADSVGSWWLRSPGRTGDCVCCWDADLSLTEVGVSADGVLVRPALWLSMEEASGEELPEETPVISSAGMVQVGNTITFGSYPQTASGKDDTPIEWLVLEVQENRALLLSRFGLNAMQYYSWKRDITWEKSLIREWLNGEFYDRAFTEEEQRAILLTEVDNSAASCNPSWKTKSGRNTEDYLFLLSFREAQTYFGLSETPQEGIRVHPTDYAVSQGAYLHSECRTKEGLTAGWWWLRSPGRARDNAIRISSDGSLSGNRVDSKTGSVRPAMWVDLNLAGF